MAKKPRDEAVEQVVDSIVQQRNVGDLTGIGYTYRDDHRGAALVGPVTPASNKPDAKREK